MSVPMVFVELGMFSYCKNYVALGFSRSLTIGWQRCRFVKSCFTFFGIKPILSETSLFMYKQTRVIWLL